MPHVDAYDLVVVGAGPAGRSAAEVAATFGRRVLVVERDRPGGAVATTGGAPTKTLREAAVALTGYRQAEVYGVRAAVPLETALPIIAGRVERVRDQLQANAARQLDALGVDYLRGDARLGPGRTVSVGQPDGTRRDVRTGAILVATGSRPAHAPGIPFDDPDVYDSDRIWQVRRVPAAAVVVGGGPVGVEFATVFAALGVPVTLVSQSERLLPAVDGELAGLVAAEFERRGVGLVLGAGASAVERRGGALAVTLSTGESLTADTVLFAAGRTPNTDGLGLAEAGVRLDARGRIAVDGYFRTTAPGVYAAGDAVAPALASTAAQQGRAAACHACGLVFGVAVDRTASSAVYGLPEVAGAGQTEEQVRESGVPYAVGRCDLAATARGAVAGHGGQLKLIFRADDRRLLGVHALGDAASELVGLGHLALHVGASVEVFLALSLNTPTYTAAYHDAAVDGLLRLAGLMGHRPRVAGRRHAAALDTVPA